MARARARNAQLASRPDLGSGRALIVSGVPHDVVVEPVSSAARGRVRRSPYSPRAEPDQPRSPRNDVLHVQPGRDGQSSAALLEAWLRREARDVLQARVAELAPIVGVVPAAVTIRGQRARWGSASRTGRISLNWRLILAPPAVLDYVVIHELAHLRVPGHSRAFWAVVRRHAPDPGGGAALAAGAPRRAARGARLTVARQLAQLAAARSLVIAVCSVFSAFLTPGAAVSGWGLVE